MRIAVLTSVLGLNNATIKDPSIHFDDPDIDYFAFVDRDHGLKIWKQIMTPKFSTLSDNYEDRRNAKLPKVLGFMLVPGYDYYIWHDSYCDLQTDPKIIINEYLKEHELGVFKHPLRDCAYDEIKECAQYSNIDNHENFINTYNFLKSVGYKENNGLFELSSFVYKNTTNNHLLFLSWWELICKFTSRDQMTFPYVVEKHNIDYIILPGSAQKYGGNNMLIPHKWDKFS